jgi:hypothetical protein
MKLFLILVSLSIGAAAAIKTVETMNQASAVLAQALEQVQ